ncbi:prolyl oligopeptidase PreP (S9A serine peptidase family) [Bradyrhizobium canariense]|nr:prolyl oligopeptidase PreP (S9A serine peptidase family) [Bradyrhizobium canariense]
MEQIEGERALGFVERQNRLTLDKFGGPAFEPDRDTLAAIYDRPDNILYVSRCGGLLSNLWKDAGNPRGLWRRTTMDEFRKGEPAREDWLLNWSSSLPGAAQVILGLARGGSDTVSLREFDRNTKSFMPNGLVVG